MKRTGPEALPAASLRKWTPLVLMVTFGSRSGGGAAGAVGEDHLVVVVAAALLLGAVEDLEVDDRVQAGDLGGLDVLGHPAEDLVEDLLAQGGVDHLGELVVVCGRDQLGELLGIELSEIRFSDGDLVGHVAPPV